VFAILESNGGTKVNWANVAIPEGRTRRASEKTYFAMKKQAAEATVVKPTDVSANTGVKGKRKAAATTANEAEDDDEDAPTVPKKKRKTPAKSRAKILKKEDVKKLKEENDLAKEVAEGLNNEKERAKRVKVR
jgi:hypothetical protein